jgi:hypothetical protein
MKIRIFTMCTAVVCVAAGCVTTPQNGGQVESAYAIGDRAQITLDEVVVSMPLRGGNGPYQNLHIGLGALVNPQKTTLYNPYTVEGIVRRLESRIASRLVEKLTGMGQQSVEDLAMLRKIIGSEAQGIVESGLQHWQHAPEYRVEVVVVSLYWTDASVGRPAQQRRSWW